jgi:tetratricopeptide (TPR) repeat protein
VELGKDDAVALTRGGHALAHLAGEVDGGVALIDKALVLNPNLAAAWFLGGFLRTVRGDPEAAIGFLTRAMRFSPLDPEMFRMQAGMALAHLFAERFDMASDWAERSFREAPTFLAAVAVIGASHALAGRMAQARTAVDHCESSILPLGSPASMAGFRSGGRSISRASRTACGWQGCRSERSSRRRPLIICRKVPSLSANDG